MTGGTSASMQVSPEFILRPSLSEGDLPALDHLLIRVAGVYTPAFVERSTRGASRARRRCSCRRSLYSGLR